MAKLEADNREDGRNGTCTFCATEDVWVVDYSSTHDPVQQLCLWCADLDWSQRRGVAGDVLRGMARWMWTLTDIMADHKDQITDAVHGTDGWTEPEEHDGRDSTTGED